MRYLTRLTLLAFPISFLLIFFTPSPTYADAGCELNSLAEPSGTATLSLAVPHIDNATWISTINLNVSLSWPLARDLFQNASTGSFQLAFNCLLPDYGFFYSPSSSPSISVSRDGNSAKLKMFSQGAISDWGVYIPWPWDVNVSQQALSVSFAPGPDKPNINWTSITATTHGFHITNPQPVPASNSGAQFTWQQLTSGPKVNLVAFSLIPEKFLRIAMTAQNDGLWQSIPLQVEELVFPILFILILNRRRDKEINAADDAWTVTRRLCIAVAALAGLELVFDILYRRTAILRWLYAGDDIGQLCIIYTTALAVLWPHLREARRRLSLSLILGCFAVTLPVVFFSDIYSFDGAVPRLPLAITGLITAFFSWVIIIDALLGILWPISGRDRPAGFPLRAAIALALVTTFVSVLSTPSNFFPTTIFPTIFLPSIAGFMITFGTLLVVARGKRSVPLIPERDDLILLALLVGYGMLLTGPQWYLGYRVGLIPIFGILVTLSVLSISREHSLLKPDDGRLSSFRPAGEALRNLPPERLKTLQLRLFDAEGQLTKVTKDLTVLQSTPLVTPEQLARRAWLENEQKRLRRWPLDESPPEATLPARLNSRVRTLLGRQKQDDDNQPGVEFPEPAGPADMALALGPACDPVGNLSRAFRPAYILVLFPACYFAWRQNLVNSTPWTSLQYYIALVENLSKELAFWLLFPLVLAVAWSSLAGRRGTERGLQVWLIFLLPIAVHVFFNQIFGQSATLTSVLQCAILLVVLLILGVWVDLSMLRESRRNVTSFKLFQGYVRLNRVVAAVTLLIPLVTAGLTIWNQINSGVLHQKVSPAQVTANTQGPASSSASPTPSGSSHPHPAKTATPRHTK
jgi:hypothetical protein